MYIVYVSGVYEKLNDKNIFSYFANYVGDKVLQFRLIIWNYYDCYLTY